ncbi:MAG: protein kinase family protein [Pseudobdellovibrionaceae bacterium]|nr:MAG: protein kinase family protein [Pseudobdellovibrionaceae bacterium]
MSLASSGQNRKIARERPVSIVVNGQSINDLEALYIGSGGFADIYSYPVSKYNKKPAVIKLITGVDKNDRPDFFKNLEESSQAAIQLQTKYRDVFLNIHEILPVQLTYADGSSKESVGIVSDRMVHDVLDEVTQNRDQNRSRALFEVSLTAKVFLTYIKGLRALYEEGLVHGDITPQNMLISPANEFVISDLDTLAEPGTSPQVTSKGTGSPEVLKRGGALSYLSDLYALAETLSVLITYKQTDFFYKGLDDSESKKLHAQAVMKMTEALSKKITKLKALLNKKRDETWLKFLDFLEDFIAIGHNYYPENRQKQLATLLGLSKGARLNKIYEQIESYLETLPKYQPRTTKVMRDVNDDLGAVADSLCAAMLSSWSQLPDAKGLSEYERGSVDLGL